MHEHMEEYCNYQFLAFKNTVARNTFISNKITFDGRKNVG